MSNYIFEAAIRIVRVSLREDDPQEALTDRETECLFWASEGKRRVKSPASWGSRSEP